MPVSTDPQELFNLIDTQAAVAVGLRNALLAWVGSMPAAAQPSPSLSEEDRRRLRSLGYTDGD